MRAQSRETEDINTLLGESLTFIGRSRNKDGGEYSLHFTTSADTYSGSLKIPKNPGEPHPQYEDYNIRLGMIFDSKDNLPGYFSETEENIALALISANRTAVAKMIKKERQKQFIVDSQYLLESDGINSTIDNLVESFGLNELVQLANGNEDILNLIAYGDNPVPGSATLDKENAARVLSRFLINLSNRIRFEQNQAYLDYRTREDEQTQHSIGNLVEAEILSRG